MPGPERVTDLSIATEEHSLIAEQEKYVKAAVSLVRLANIEWYGALLAYERGPGTMARDRLDAADRNVDQELDFLVRERQMLENLIPKYPVTKS